MTEEKDEVVTAGSEAGDITVHVTGHMDNELRARAAAAATNAAGAVAGDRACPSCLAQVFILAALAQVKSTLLSEAVSEMSPAGVADVVNEGDDAGDMIPFEAAIDLLSIFIGPGHDGSAVRAEIDDEAGGVLFKPYFRVAIPRPDPDAN